MKSKEDILREEYENVFTAQKYDNSVNRAMNQKYFFPAMDQYSRQMAIAFAEWKQDNGWRWLKSIRVWTNKNDDSYPTEELYNLFLQHQSQQP